MAGEIDMTPLAERSGPQAEASWREDIRRAAIAGGASEAQAVRIAGAALSDLPAWRSGVEYGLYYGWSRAMSGVPQDASRAILDLHPGLAALYPDFAGMAARWIDDGLRLVEP